MKLLLGTSVLSELSKSQPDKRVLGWFHQVDESHLYISVISLGEISHGLENNRIKLGVSRSNNPLKWIYFCPIEPRPSEETPRSQSSS